MKKHTKDTYFKLVGYPTGGRIITKHQQEIDRVVEREPPLWASRRSPSAAAANKMPDMTWRQRHKKNKLTLEE